MSNYGLDECIEIANKAFKLNPAIEKKEISALSQITIGNEVYSIAYNVSGVITMEACLAELGVEKNVDAYLAMEAQLWSHKGASILLLGYLASADNSEDVINEVILRWKTQTPDNRLTALLYLKYIYERGLFWEKKKR